jgi:hypothetical protein
VNKLRFSRRRSRRDGARCGLGPPSGCMQANPIGQIEKRIVSTHTMSSHHLLNEGQDNRRAGSSPVLCVVMVRSSCSLSHCFVPRSPFVAMTSIVLSILPSVVSFLLFTLFASLFSPFRLSWPLLWAFFLFPVSRHSRRFGRSSL